MKIGDFFAIILFMKIAVEITIESLQKETAEQRAEILSLKEQNAWLLRQIFGKKSERVVDADQEQLRFDGFESASQQTAEMQTIPIHERKKRTSPGKDAIKLPDDLPVETTVIDIPEGEKVCKETGIPLQKIGEEVSHKLAYRPGSYFLKRIVRPKYAHPQQEEKGIAIAPMPESLLPKCRADESLLADIITRKFGDHLPLYRIAEGFTRDNIVINRRLLSQWVLAVGIALRPLYDAMKNRILESDRIHIDELIDRIKKRLSAGIILPKSKFKEALGYFCSLIPYLKNYTQHASARLDNNPAERAIRPLAIGRKNWLFFGSTESGEAAATLLSLTQTCRALNINPRTYLEDICRRIMGHSANKLHELLPDEWLKAQI